jgi:hypothetical protein
MGAQNAMMQFQPLALTCRTRQARTLTPSSLTESNIRQKPLDASPTTHSRDKQVIDTTGAR